MIMSIKNIIPKIFKKYPLSELIYISNESCVYKSMLSNNNQEKIIKITPYTYKKYSILKSISYIKHDYLLTPEIVKKYGNFTLSVYPYKTSVINKIIKDKLNFSDIITLALNLCDGIIHLHSEKYLHLDISPNNIYLNNDDTFCIGDFSSAQKIKSKNIRRNIYFTKGFSPPEFDIYSKKKTKITELSDEYSIAKTILALCYTYNNKEVDIPSGTYSSSIPDKFLNILNKAASEIPEFRYPDMQTFKNTISDFKSEYDICDIDFNIHFTETDNPFYALKTEPIKKDYIERPQSFIINIINSPVFITIIILVSIILPILSIYNIFFMPQINNNISTQNIASSYVTTTHPTYALNKKTTESEFKNTSNDKPMKEIDFKSKSITSISKEQIEKNFGYNINFNSIKILSATNNNISDITKLSTLTTIEELYLSGNKIKNIDSIKHLSNLKTLIISSNLIEDISSLSNLKQLENLDLSDNKQISSFKPIIRLKKLKLLCLNETNIGEKCILELKKELPQCNIIY